MDNMHYDERQNDIDSNNNLLIDVLGRVINGDTLDSREKIVYAGFKTDQRKLAKKRAVAAKKNLRKRQKAEKHQTKNSNIPLSVSDEMLKASVLRVMLSNIAPAVIVWIINGINQMPADGVASIREMYRDVPEFMFALHLMSMFVAAIINKKLEEPVEHFARDPLHNTLINKNKMHKIVRYQVGQSKGMFNYILNNTDDKTMNKSVASMVIREHLEQYPNDAIRTKYREDLALLCQPPKPQRRIFQVRSRSR